jgi:hypothetical protein
VDHPHLQILALKFEEMARDSIPYQHIATMATQFQEMGAAVAEVKSLDGSDLEELLHFLILALRSEEITKKLELRFETMETSQMEMVEALIAWQLKQAGLALEVLKQLLTPAQKFEEMEWGIIPYQLIVMMETLLQEMDEAVLAQLKSDTFVVEELLQSQMLALQSEGTAEESEMKLEMTEPYWMEMVEVPLALLS